MSNPLRALLRTEPFGADDDPDAAPIAYCGGEAAEPWTPRRALQNLGWAYLFGLLFMIFTIGGIGDGDPGAGEFALRIAVLVAICLAYVGTSVVADTGLRVRWIYLLGFVGLTALTALYNGWFFVSYGVYVSMVIAGLIPWRVSRWVVPVWNLLVLAVAVPTWSMTPVIIAVMGLLVGWATGGGIESGRVRHRLDQAERRMAVLSVEAERERIARDLHDILGHSLTAVSIKSGLAGKLVDVDPAAAREQMNEVEQIARVALADVRATTTGLREVRLATEVASARSVLMAAGVEADTPTALPPLAPDCSELLGYAVREAVTNVVRHAEATRCVITASEHGVTVSDDGVGLGRRAGGGSGIAGLQRRFDDAGGRIDLGTSEGGGTVLSASLQSTGTATAVQRVRTGSDPIAADGSPAPGDQQPVPAAADVSAAPQRSADPEVVTR